jgi:hypothetical protein
MHRACLAGVAASAVAVLAAGPALAADKTLPELIAGSCRANAAGSSQGHIEAADLRKALTKIYPIVWTWDPQAPPSNEAIISGILLGGQSPGNVPESDNRKTFIAVGQLFDDWAGVAGAAVLPEAEGGVTVLRRDGRPVMKDDVRRAVRAVYLGAEPNSFTFRCGKPTKPEPDAPDGEIAAPKSSVVIAKSADQFGKSGDEKEKGELGLTADRHAHETLFGTNIAVGLAFPIFGGRKKDEFRGAEVVQGNVTPFIAFDRQGGDDPTDKTYVNNLSFGLSTDGYLALRTGSASVQSHTFTTYYSLVGRYETDDRFKSAAYIAELHLQPILPLAGNSSAYYFASGPKLEFGGLWSIAGVADHAEVDDPWKKQKLLDTKEYTRLGYDATIKAILRPAYGQGDWSVQWQNDLSVRRDQTDNHGSARLFSSKLTFAPAKNYGFSLGYQEGRVLDSLEKIRQIKITIDLKR